jgi:hypothetical protein
MQVLEPSDSPSLPALTLPRVGSQRILLGLLQGLLLYLLYRAARDQAWPATHFLLFVPLVLVALFVPPILISGLGHMRRRRLVLWGAAAALVLAGLGCYAAWRTADLPPPLTGPSGARHARIPGVSRSTFPPEELLVFAAAGLFIAHALVMAAVRERRRIAAYTTYFDTAWKLGVQLAFSGLFTGVSWLVLFLGAQLFELVKLKFLTELLREEWFAIPVTAFAFACAMHLTDVRPAIVNGIRGLLLALMSWLLPVAVLLIGGFLATLPFTGLAPLWSTRHAASVLLAAAAALVVLVNAAWQQGGSGKEAAPAVNPVVRAAARIAALLLAPLVLIAIYALFLRVRDYGWTGDRVSAAACMLVAACYAGGYFGAALRPGWLPSLAQVNIGAAFVIIAVLLALFSPLLDPARISVNSQLARLASGKARADTFDFAFLRFDGERFGRAALDRLERTASGADAALLRRQVAVVRKMEGRWSRNQPQPPADLAANLRVHPDGARLPESFLRTDWLLKDQAYLYPDCLRRADRRCDAFLLDVTGDGKPEVLLFRVQGVQGTDGRNTGPDNLALGEDAQGRWSAYANLMLPAIDCKALQGSLDTGKVGAIPAALADVEIGGLRARLTPVDSHASCRLKP